MYLGKAIFGMCGENICYFCQREDTKSNFVFIEQKTDGLQKASSIIVKLPPFIIRHMIIIILPFPYSAGDL